MKIKHFTILYIIIITGFIVLNVFVAHAYTMSSSNYRIQQDSINTGGLDVSTSTNYRIKDTIGEIATGKATSTSYNLYAGYRQMDEAYISISEGGAVTLTPSIGGVTGGTATGSTSFTITTDNTAGYSLDINASTDPALKSSSYSFADYTTNSNPDYTWLIVATSSEFGFSPEGSDIVQKFKDDGNACNTGSSDTSNKCWYGLDVSDENIASSASSNHPSGTQTTIKFQAESGSSHLQEAGSYGAVITVTAVAQ